MSTEASPVLQRIRAAGWLLLMGLASLSGLVLLAGLLVSSVLSFVIIGVPLLLALTTVVRGLADAHRLWAHQVMGLTITRPYRPLPAARHMFARLKAILADPATWRDLAWLALNSTFLCVLCLIPPLALLSSFFWFLQAPVMNVVLPDWMLASYSELLLISELELRWAGMIVFVPLELTVFWLGTKPMLRFYARFLKHFLGPPETALLAQRVDELAESRAEAVDTQAAELRRVERDLHDGAQARLVSLGLTLGMAEKLLNSDPAMARDLLAEARESSGQALSELRDLVRGIHPPVLADRGLEGALRALALSHALPVEVSAELPGRVPAPVESAVYFAVAESLTNVAKHSAANSAWIFLAYERDRLRVQVGDDGRGGARDDTGGGLRGMQRRLAAFDGTMTVLSPAGGPTLVTMELPCELSSVKTTPSSEMD